MWQTNDLTSLGVLANLSRERISGNAAFYRPACHVRHTQNPILGCPACTRMVRSGLDPFRSEAWENLLQSIDPEVTAELHLTGGADSRLGVADLVFIARRARELRPNLKLRAFTWPELERASEHDNLPPARILGALAEAGLTTLAGGTLMDLAPVKRHLTPESLEQMERRLPWIEAASALGLTCELAWVFGDEDDPEIIADTLTCIRGLQDHWKVFTCFEPLLFQWPSEEIEIPIPTGYNQLRAIAVGRLFLDNIPHVRGSWWSLTESILQVAQWYGADDAGTAALAASADATFGPGCARLEEYLVETRRDPVNALLG